MTTEAPESETAHEMSDHGKEDEQMNHLVHVETAYIVHCR